jgi:hypothetical protein
VRGSVTRHQETCYQASTIPIGTVYIINILVLSLYTCSVLRGDCVCITSVLARCILEVGSFQWPGHG